MCHLFGIMNATFNCREALRLFDSLKYETTSVGKWVRVSCEGDSIGFASGHASVALTALVLEPGAFTIRRLPFQRVLGSFRQSKTLTLQADAGRFRVGAFSGQVLDYTVNPSDEFSERDFEYAESSSIIAIAQCAQMEFKFVALLRSTILPIF